MKPFKVVYLNRHTYNDVRAHDAAEVTLHNFYKMTSRSSHVNNYTRSISRKFHKCVKISKIGRKSKGKRYGDLLYSLAISCFYQFFLDYDIKRLKNEIQSYTNNSSQQSSDTNQSYISTRKNCIATKDIPSKQMGKDYILMVISLIKVYFPTASAVNIIGTSPMSQALRDKFIITTIVNKDKKKN